MKITEKQMCVLTTLLMGHERGRYLTLNELIDNIPYKITKPAIQHTLRNLIGKKLVEKDDLIISESRHHERLLKLTTLGRAMAKRHFMLDEN